MIGSFETVVLHVGGETIQDFTGGEHFDSRFLTNNTRDTERGAGMGAKSLLSQFLAGLT